MDEATLYQDLGRAVAQRRAELKLTQEAVAKRAGISRASLANIEVGRQKVLVHQLYRIANALSLDSPSKLLPLATASTEAGEISLSGGVFSAKQRAQIEKVYKSIAPAKRGDGKH